MLITIQQPVPQVSSIKLIYEFSQSFSTLVKDAIPNLIVQKKVLNSFSGLSSSRRHLQGGGSLSGSLRGINSDLLPIPPAPLPPTSVPPHICIGGGDLMMDDDDDIQDDLFMNGDRFSSGDSV